jgi:hypothetical protein
MVRLTMQRVNRQYLLVDLQGLRQEVSAMQLHSRGPQGGDRRIVHGQYRASSLSWNADAKTT